MGVANIIILTLVAAAFIAVCVRVRRKGTCADCSSAGSCSSCGQKGCPACKGVDKVADDLGRGVR